MRRSRKGLLWPPVRSLSSAVPTVQSPDRRPDCGNSRWCRDTDRLLRPHQATSTHCLSPQKPVSSCQTCFLFVFFFMSLMWPGECFLPFVPQFHAHFFPFLPSPPKRCRPLSVFLFLWKIVICKALSQQTGPIFVVVLWSPSPSPFFFLISVYEVLAKIVLFACL